MTLLQIRFEVGQRLVHAQWTKGLAANGISSKSSEASRRAQRHETSSQWERSLAKWSAAYLQEQKKPRPQIRWQMRFRSNQLLCHTNSFTAARFSGTEISRSRNHWGCGTSLYFPPEISLWVELYWVLLGSSEEVFTGALWLYLWWAEGKYPESSRISPAFNHSEVGAPYDLMDGGIQGG